jgi:hypothetical protein
MSMPRGSQSRGDLINGLSEVIMLEFIDRGLAVFSAVQAWFLALPMPMQIVVGLVALAVLWVLWIILRVTLAVFRATF